MPPARSIAALLIAASSAAVSAQPGEIIAWGELSHPLLVPPPPGIYATIAVGSGHGLALRPDGTMVGWGANFYGQSVPQPGLFTAIAVGVDHSVALRTDGTAVSWGRNLFGEAVTPPGTFVSISAGYRSSGGIRPDGTVELWGLLDGTEPLGTFTFLSVGGGNTGAAIRTDGTMITWGSAPPAISGAFGAVNISASLSSALRDDGTAVSFGSIAPSYPAPAGEFTQLSASSSGYPGALRADGTIAVWGPHAESVFDFPSGRYSFVAIGPQLGMAIRPCPANCDLSSSAPYLTPNDFICFLNKYASASPNADCDHNTSGPVLTPNDFICFLNAYAAGCS
jgi:hypothetical protein